MTVTAVITHLLEASSHALAVFVRSLTETSTHPVVDCSLKAT